jgi:lysophospholipase L1-like esterase
VTQAGPAIPVIAVTDRAADGGPALRVAVVSDGRGVEAGDARPVVVVSDGRPTQGNDPLPIVVATGAQASRILAGPAIPVVVVSGSLAAGTVPANTVLPVISGTTELGQTLTTTDGTWTGTPAPTFTYQWYRNGVAIVGATNNTYVLQSADLGTTITVVVTATNVAGSTPATSAGTSIPAWLLLDRFTTAQAAPLTSPRNCEPGPGVFTIIDTGNKLSIAGAKLVSLAPTSGFADPRVSAALIARIAGRALLAKGAKGNSFRLGYGDSGDSQPRGGPLLNSGAFFHYDNASPVGQLVTASGAVSYDLLTVQQDYNAWSAVKNGAWANWTMLFQGGVRSGSNVLTNAAADQKIYFDVNAAWEVDDFLQWDLGGSFGRSFLWGQANIEPASGTTFASAADLFATAEWSAAAAATFELSIRRTDDDNRWIVRGDVTGATIKLIERNAGVETERATAAQTWSTSDKTRVWVRAEGQRICYGTEGAQKNVYTSASFNLSATGVKVTASNANGLVNYRAIPLAVPSFTEGASAGLATVNFFPVGDSKTVGTGDTAPPNGTLSGYPRWLADQVEQATARGCYERSARIGRGGATAAVINTNIVADLTTRNHVPTYILVNVGANDASAGTAQATFEAAYGSFLDVLHAKWPTVPIYCMRVWVRNFAAACNAIDDTWIPNVLSTRSAWAFLGPDERIFLENGDNGVTYTADGIHPNRAGYILTAAQWKTVLGI